MINIDAKLKQAIKHFWRTRDVQSKSQGSSSGVRDTGARTAVTGGKHLDGFVAICRDILIDAGIHSDEIHWQSRLELPGYFRAEKNWDLVVVVRGQLLAVIEFKAQVGPSFGNNFNNRAEESLGNATDLWAAYREGAFAQSPRPWLGFVFILEDCEKSQSSVKVKEPHYPVFPEFHGASYTKRYQILLTKLHRERLYDGTSLILSNRYSGQKGESSCPATELSFHRFAISLHAHANSFSRLNPR